MIFSHYNRDNPCLNIPVNSNVEQNIDKLNSHLQGLTLRLTYKTEQKI